MYQDTEWDPRSEQREEQERLEEQIDRRVRREVRRIRSGEADADMAADAEREALEEAERQEAEERERKRSQSLVRGLVSGSVIGRQWISEHYRYPLMIAGIFLLSIIVMFCALGLDMKYSRREREVQLLRERAIRLQEQRYSRTTHSAILQRLYERNIPLRDPQTPGHIIQD